MQTRAVKFAAVLLVVLLCVGLLQTPTVAKALEYMQEQVIKVIEKLFPPKEIEINLEGLGGESVFHGSYRGGRKSISGNDQYLHSG